MQVWLLTMLTARSTFLDGCLAVVVVPTLLLLAPLRHLRERALPATLPVVVTDTLITLANGGKLIHIC